MGKKNVKVRHWRPNTGPPGPAGPPGPSSFSASIVAGSNTVVALANDTTYVVLLVGATGCMPTSDPSYISGPSENYLVINTAGRYLLTLNTQNVDMPYGALQLAAYSNANLIASVTCIAGHSVSASAIVFLEEDALISLRFISTAEETINFNVTTIGLVYLNSGPQS